MHLTQYDLAQLEGSAPDPKREAKRLISEAVKVLGSRKELARRLGVAPSTVMYWFYGGRVPGQGSLEAMQSIVKGGE